MAKFIIEADTDAETLVVTVDGTPVENVSSVNAYIFSGYNYYDSDNDPKVRVCVYTQEKTGDVTTTTTLCASVTDETPEKPAEIVSTDKLKNDIQNYFNRK